MKTVILFFCVLFITFASFAQEQPSQIRPFQLSFVYPIGTSGTHSANNGYFTSVNLLAGITGSANGLEIGGLANLNKHYNHGFQLAGLCNITGDYSSGAVFAGLCNINGGNASGIQVGGIGNVAGGSVNGIQFGGLFNVAGNTFRGAAFSGITNIAGGNVKGVEVSGIINLADSIKGVQATGGINLARSADAIQVAGISNITAGGSKAQLAGVGNVAEEVKGIQIAGVFNIAGMVKGVQLAGVVNICDSIDGVPIALISIVRKNGYRRFEIWSSEVFYMNLSYKIGIRELYSIITLGYRPGDLHNNTGFGLGLGSNMQLAGRNSLDIEGYIYHINHYLWMDEENFLYTLKLNYVRNFNERIALFIGPTLNMLSTPIYSDAHDIAPDYGIEQNSRYDWQYWVGFNAGVRF